jgi:hypothetical protein
VCEESGGASPAAANRGDWRRGGRRRLREAKWLGFTGERGTALEWNEGGRRAAVGWLPICSHAGPANGRRRTVAVRSGQRAKPEARGRRGRGLTGGPRASGKKRKMMIQLPNLKTCTSLALKITKNLLEQDQTTKNTVQ